MTGTFDMLTPPKTLIKLAPLALDYEQGKDDHWGVVRLYFPLKTTAEATQSAVKAVCDSLVYWGYAHNNVEIRYFERTQYFEVNIRFICGAYLFTDDPRREEVRKLNPEMVKQLLNEHFLSTSMLEKLRERTDATFKYIGTATAQPVLDEDGTVANYIIVIKRIANPDKSIQEELRIEEIDEDKATRIDMISKNISTSFYPHILNGREPVTSQEAAEQLIRELMVGLNTYLMKLRFLKPAEPFIAL